jgi:hypothetical protein
VLIKSFITLSTRCWAPCVCGILIFGAFMAIATQVHAESISMDLRGAWSYDNNISNTEPENFREEDMVFEFDAIAGYRQELNDYSGIVAKVGIETDGHMNFGDLNSLTLMGSLAYVFQPIRSFSAPWFAVSTELRRRQHADSEIRDGTITTLAFTAGTQVTDRISAQARFELLDRDADQGRAFEMGQRIVSTAIDFRATDRITAYAKYAYLDGDLVTSAPRNPKLGPVSRAVDPDPVFGAGRWAWRIDGRAHSFHLGGKYALAERTALDVGLSYSHAHAENDNQWNTWRLGASVLHRF